MELAYVRHQGIIKTKALIHEKVWFSGIDHMVEKMIRNCMPFQVTTPSMTQEPLKMSPLPERPWSELSIDFWPGSRYVDHWIKTYVSTTLGIHWVCTGNILNSAN